LTSGRSVGQESRSLDGIRIVVLFPLPLAPAWS